jgi:hypothetical protein
VVMLMRSVFDPPPSSCHNKTWYCVAQVREQCQTDLWLSNQVVATEHLTIPVLIISWKEGVIYIAVTGGLPL